MFQRALRASLLLPLLLLESCISDPPPLATTPDQGPTLPYIANHIDCELASIVGATPGGIVTPANARVYEHALIEPQIFDLLKKLVDYHFVASVLLTIDTTDSEGLSPSLTTIHPFTSVFSRAVTVNPQLSGTQERNKNISYSVDMALVQEACRPDALRPTAGISGNLGLADVIIDGLNGLEATQRVNVYGTGGPTRPAFDAFANIRLGARCSGNSGHCQSNTPDFNIDIRRATMSFAPSSDPQQPGNLSLNGEAKSDDGRSYMISLAGNTVTENDKTIRFTLTGNMTREGSFKEDTLGFNPTVTLTGKINKDYEPKEPSGLLTPSSDALNTQPLDFSLLGSGKVERKQQDSTPNSQTGKPDQPKPDKTPSTPGAGKEAQSDQKNQGEKPAPGRDVFVLGAPVGKPSKPSLFGVHPVAAIFGSSPSGVGQSSGASKGASLGGSSPTQFGSLINFGLSYGINGGPTWTLSTFKGPAGGVGTVSGGQLFGANRTNTDTLTITFVPACQDNNIRAFKTFWDTVPKCNGTGSQTAAAAAIGYQYNVLLQTGRGL